MQVRGVSQMVETGQESVRAAVSRAPLSADDAGVNNARLNEIRLQESLIHDWFLLVTVGFCLQPSDRVEKVVFLFKYKNNPFECPREMEN